MIWCHQETVRLIKKLWYYLTNKKWYFSSAKLKCISPKRNLRISAKRLDFSRKKLAFYIFLYYICSICSKKEERGMGYKMDGGPRRTKGRHDVTGHLWINHLPVGGIGFCLARSTDITTGHYPLVNIQKTYGKITIYSWVNPLFLWSFSIAFCMFTPFLMSKSTINGHFQ